MYFIINSNYFLIIELIITINQIIDCQNTNDEK